MFERPTDGLLRVIVGLGLVWAGGERLLDRIRLSASAQLVPNPGPILLGLPEGSSAGSLGQRSALPTSTCGNRPGRPEPRFAPRQIKIRLGIHGGRQPVSLDPDRCRELLVVEPRQAQHAGGIGGRGVAAELPRHRPQSLLACSTVKPSTFQIT